MTHLSDFREGENIVRAAVRLWRGGATTEVLMPVNALTSLPRYAEMESRILEMARAGLSDGEIVRTLTDEGHRSPRRQVGVLPSTVREVRLRHGIKAVRRQTRFPAVPGYLTVAQIVERLKIPDKWLREQLRRETIRTVRETSGRYLIPGTPGTPAAEKAIRALRARVVKRFDLREHHHD